MSDRRAWLDEWCPRCGSAPGHRCSRQKGGRHSRVRSEPMAHLHVARGWRGRRCPTCTASEGEPCRTLAGREASNVHAARFPPGRHELWGKGVWEELERREVSVAVVEFSGRAGQGGQAMKIELSRVDGDSSVGGRYEFRDEFAFALEAPVWERWGAFAGQPPICGELTWNVEQRLVVISGRRGDQRFEEIVQ